MNGKRLPMSFLVAAAGLLASAWGEGGAYEAFNGFCAEHLGAEREEEVYRAFGKTLRLWEGSRWRHVSERSACIAWQTNLPARTFVEYGETAHYGRRTPEPERPFFTHAHYLRGLKPGTTYHYRLVSVDERGNRLAGEDETLTTLRAGQAIRIPDDVAGPPHVLGRAGATYLVTRDIAAPGTAIFVAASGITLDLGGHTITYDEQRDTTGQGACGVRGHKSRGVGLKDVRVVNGVVRQGRGASSTRKLWDTLYNPLFFSKPRTLELAGVTLDYGGEQVVGIALLLGGEGVDVHHNVVVDRGTALLDRHVGMDALFLSADRSRCRHNLVKRTRHRGIRTSPRCSFDDNEIYVDSHATNSYGIIVYGRDGRDVKVRHNRIFGTGYHPIGIGSFQGYSRVEVLGNYIQMQGTPPRGRWRGGQGGGDDPNQLHPVNGIRLQSCGSRITLERNVVVARGRGAGCLMRGLWLVPGEASGPELVIRGNRVKVLAEDGVAEGYALSCGGAREPKPDATVQLFSNVVVSNLCHVQFGDNYSHGGRYRFHSDRFVRVGDDTRYRTIRMGWQGWKYESFGHVFRDTAFEGGAGFDRVSFDGTQRGRYEFDVAWTLAIDSVPGAKIAVRDAAGAEAFSGVAPADGKLAAPLVAYRRGRAGREPRGPYEVTAAKDAEKGGWETTTEVEISGPTTVKLRP